MAWHKISVPKEEGGLGIKNVTDWNKALILMQLWNLVRFNSTSYWSAWVKKFCIKGNNFWTLPIPSDCSWIWRKVLQLRHLARQHIHYQIGNGSRINLWFDPWFSHSSLAYNGHDPLILNSGLPTDATVSSIINQSTWNLPASNHTVIMEFRQRFDFSRVCNSNAPDMIKWEGFDEALVKTATIWDTIRTRLSPVPWYSIAYHKFLTPRLSFHLWFSFHRRLKTLDKLVRYGINVNPVCVLCSVDLETFDHLFFQCQFSFQILFPVMRLCGWRGSQRNWVSLTEFLASCIKSNVRHGIMHLGFAAVSYGIWQERNARIFSQNVTPARTITRNIIHLIRCKLHLCGKFQRDKFRNCFSHLLLHDV